jgi:hypothetical protein
MTGNRLLVATAVAHYPKAPRWDRPGLVAAREEIIRLFTGTFGYTHLSDLGLNPTAEQLTTQLRAVCGGRPRTITWWCTSPDTGRRWRAPATMCC